jgi:hypothetical protein
MKVYKAINAIQAELAKSGITKGRKNQSQGYAFRGIDDVYNAVSPLMAAHGLCVLPRALSREVIERATKSGNALFYVTVEVEFDFVSSEDASKHTIKTYGEAMDSADKATNKAMSAAYKYAIIQAFAIPTEGDNDPDNDTPPEVKTTKNTYTKPQTQTTPYKKTITQKPQTETNKEHTFEQSLTLIKNAKTQADLKEVYEDAMDKFKNKKEAMAILIKEKNIRKSELIKLEEEAKVFIQQLTEEKNNE